MCIELGLVNYRYCVGIQFGKYPDYVPVMLLHINASSLEVLMIIMAAVISTQSALFKFM